MPDESFFTPAPEPPTPLSVHRQCEPRSTLTRICRGRYRNLSKLASVLVSPLCLGGASIGDKWQKFGLGSMTKEESFKLLDAFYEAGGNFIDTANS